MKRPSGFGLKEVSGFTVSAWGLGFFLPLRSLYKGSKDNYGGTIEGFYTNMAPKSQTTSLNSFLGFVVKDLSRLWALWVLKP